MLIVIACLVLTVLVVEPLTLLLPARLLKAKTPTYGRALLVGVLSTLLAAAMLAAEYFARMPALLLDILILLPVYLYLIDKLMGLRFWRTVACAAAKVLLGLGWGLVIIRWFLEAFVVPSGGMRPTLLPGDRVLTEKLSVAWRKPQRGEVVVFHPPHRSHENYIQRVIAVPGDQVSLANGQIHVNGSPQGAYEIPLHLMDGLPGLELPCTLPQGKYLMLGDNRPSSLDSRFYGLVDQSALTAYPVLVYMSHELDTHDRPSGRQPGSIRWGRILTLIR